MNGIEYLLNELTPDKGVKFTYPHPIVGGDHMAEFHMYITLNNEGKPFKVVSRLGERMFVDSIKTFLSNKLLNIWYGESAVYFLKTIISTSVRC